MKSSLQGPPETATQPQDAIPAPTGLPARLPSCPECLCTFQRKHPGQLFCTTAHRDSWNNRATVRGRVLTPLAIVTRATRGGSRGDTETGRKARQHHDALIQRWVAEDRAEGRMDWPTYLRLRYRVGFDPLT